MLNYRTQEMIIFLIFFFTSSDPHREEGEELTGLSRIKPSVYKTWLESSDPRQDVQGVLQEVLAFTEL